MSRVMCSIMRLFFFCATRKAKNPTKQEGSVMVDVRDLSPAESNRRTRGWMRVFTFKSQIVTSKVRIRLQLIERQNTPSMPT
jgi:hypothetical protein